MKHKQEIPPTDSFIAVPQFSKEIELEQCVYVLCILYSLGRRWTLGLSLIVAGLACLLWTLSKRQVTQFPCVYSISNKQLDPFFQTGALP